MFAAVAEEDGALLEESLSMNPQAIRGGERLLKSRLSDVSVTTPSLETTSAIPVKNKKHKVVQIGTLMKGRKCMSMPVCVCDLSEGNTLYAHILSGWCGAVGCVVV